MFLDRAPRRRWPRSQRFTLSEKGREAEASYRSTIVASRAEEGGRASYDAARTAWATSLGIQPNDGLHLGEIGGEPKTLDQIAQGVESSGETKKDALTALERLVDAGLVVPVPA